ncbi:hypothetical protein Isop_1298 [Isosphaera pallida ATCC 43644]|uniref:Uncharacterized protein n=1 Tax=Isosphaera pallida (strain ATCC 43644 / DSM 9630 / IS1B) TaxID=575540 RepID=E8QWJ2_ISOPI|nr:hypothetical protein [Isosphaera pallida]ADV61884.1 hypothetical protein Isop_1298 [Isosphaera pallida ATCC 43644]
MPPGWNHSRSHIRSLRPASHSRPVEKASHWLASLRLLVGIMVCPGVLGGISGCGFVPVSRLNECANLNRALLAENAALRDLEQRLRTRNADLARRNGADEIERALLVERNRRLESTIEGLQRDITRMTNAYDQLRRVVQADVFPTARDSERDRLDATLLEAGGTSEPPFNDLDRFALDANQQDPPPPMPR